MDMAVPQRISDSCYQVCLVDRELSFRLASRSRVGWLWDDRESSPALVRAANVAQTMASRGPLPQSASMRASGS